MSKHKNRPDKHKSAESGNENVKTAKNEKPSGPANSSLVYKLNAWHLGQIFWACIVMDILLVIIFGGIFLYETYGDFALIDYRSLIIIDKANDTIKLREELREPFSLLMLAIKIIAGIQLFYILTHIWRDAKAIRRRLRPIAELTQTARNISSAGFSGGIAGARHSEKELRDLAGTISTIDVDQLDKRITVDAAQNELKDLAAAINDMLDRIDQAYRAQIRFVSDASHELRTPIAVIQGYANLLDRWGKNDEKALMESIDAIKGEADNMKNLVEQLLFLARGDTDTMQLNMETVNISMLVSEIFRETEMIDPNHTFILKSDENVKVTAFADEQLIKQAVRIFIDNSIKYTPGGQNITIAAKQEEGYAVITIQDNGIGIPEKDVQFIFDRFFRADESRARKTGGTGLGLSIARWIIDRHGGSIDVISRHELGTRITVKLPSKKIEAEE